MDCMTSFELASTDVVVNSVPSAIGDNIPEASKFREMTVRGLRDKTDEDIFASKHGWWLFIGKADVCFNLYPNCISAFHGLVRVSKLSSIISTVILLPCQQLSPQALTVEAPWLWRVFCCQTGDGD